MYVIRNGSGPKYHIIKSSYNSVKESQSYDNVIQMHKYFTFKCSALLCSSNVPTALSYYRNRDNYWNNKRKERGNQEGKDYHMQCEAPNRWNYTVGNRVKSGYIENSSALEKRN